MAHERRRRVRRRRGAEPSQPNIFSRLVPDVIERPAEKVLGGALGFTGNLLGDVKDAVVGLPMGLVTTVKDPGTAVKAVAGGIWSTWSPLFQGDIEKFAHQVYDHPLSPILDVASVFTLGAGAAARGATALERAGSTSMAVSKVAGLRKGGQRTLIDPKGERPPIVQPLSRRAGRRLVQTGLQRMDDYLPKFYTSFRYERAHLTRMAHRAVTARFIEGLALNKGRKIELDSEAAYNGAFLQASTALNAAELVEDITEQGKRARTATFAEMHSNLIRHNQAFDPVEAKQYVQKGHYRYIVAPEHLDRARSRQLGAMERRIRKSEYRWIAKKDRLESELQGWERVRQETAELANSEQRIVDELREANEALREMRDTGTVVAGGARYVSGARKGQPIEKPNRRQLMRYESEAVQEATERVARLEKLREDAIRAKRRHDEAVERINRVREVLRTNESRVALEADEFFALREKAAQDFYSFAGDTYEGFTKAVQEFGRIAVTKDPRRALRTDDGKVYIAPRHDAYNLGLEGTGSLRFMHELIHRPTRLWKMLVVGYSPRTVVNNGVGNWFMWAARELPSGTGLIALKDAFEFRFGKHVTDGDPLWPKDHWLHRWFSDELADQFTVGNELVDPASLADPRGNILKRAARQGFYPLVYSLTERPVRVAAIYKALRDMPEVQDEIARFRKRGVTGQKAVDRGIERAIRKNPMLREEAALASRRIAGDYVTLSAGEKWARDLIPFYLWNRHILKTTGNMLLDTPGRLAVGAELSDLGIEQTEELLGEIPDFLKGAIPLAALGLGDRTGRANVLLTASLNPYATVGELAESLNAFATGEGRRGAAFSQFNPFVVGAAESAFEKSLLTGEVSPRQGGIATDVLGRVLEQLPEARIFDAATTADTELTPKGNEFLYARDDRSPITSFLGVPLRNVSLERAAALVREQEDEQTTTSRRRRRERRG